jgi:hypothetical protein
MLEVEDVATLLRTLKCLPYSQKKEFNEDKLINKQT